MVFGAMSRSYLATLLAVVLGVVIYCYLLSNLKDAHQEAVYILIYEVFALGALAIGTRVMYKNNAYQTDPSKVSKENEVEIRKCHLLLFIISFGLHYSLEVLSTHPTEILIKNVLHTVRIIQFIVFVLIVMFEEGIIQYYFGKFVTYLSNLEKDCEKPLGLIDVFKMAYFVGAYCYILKNTDDAFCQKMWNWSAIIFSGGVIIISLDDIIKRKLYNHWHAFLCKRQYITREHKRAGQIYYLLAFFLVIGCYCYTTTTKYLVLQTWVLRTMLIMSAGVVSIMLSIMGEKSIKGWFWTVVYEMSKKERSEEEKKKVRFIKELDDMMNYLDEFDQEWEDYMNELESYDEDETKKQILEFVIYMDRFLNKGTKYTDKMMEEYYELSDKAEEYINPVIINEYSYDNDDHTDMEFITEIDKIVRQFDKFIDKHSEYFNKSYDGLNGFNKLKKKMKKFVDRGEMFVDEMAHDYYFAE